LPRGRSVRTTGRRRIHLLRSRPQGPAPSATRREGRLDFFNLLLTSAYNMSSAIKIAGRAHGTVCDDPWHLAWQVSEILWLASVRLTSTRPLPARPAGESDSDAKEKLLFGQSARRFARPNLIQLPHKVAGVLRRGRAARVSYGISFTCRASRAGVAANRDVRPRNVRMAGTPIRAAR